MERRSERRLVSCVFIDLVGSTGMGQRLGPERMQRVRVLERIVTDKGIAVADEIERLRDDRVN